MRKLFIKQTQLPRSAQSVYDWHMEPGALKRLTPAWEKVSMRPANAEIKNGLQVELLIGSGPIKIKWLAEHCDVEPGKGFTDFQVRGPFKFWKHRHEFEDNANGCLLTDRIEYELPFDFIVPFGDFFVRQKLKRMFDYRHEVTRADLG
ncbi:SRPBCC family protein [bacterium]|nr:SRPBCC family protein [bacterium]QQR58194.1 MAG: SRPBCC family protein [Candidatus Melainabacteria bacterium]